MYVVVSYQEEYSEYYRGSCEGSGCADLEINHCEDFDKLVDYLAHRCAANNPQANLIFTNWEDFLAFAKHRDVTSICNKHENSILVEGLEEWQLDDSEWSDRERNVRLGIRSEQSFVTN
jgi:hypothetical protein